MGQVPHYLIIGNGRVAQHFQYYFSLLSLTFSTWQRKEPLNKLHQALKTATHILLLINDDVIDEFATLHLKNNSAFVIHFSGSLVSNRVFGAHPLMCFGNALYTLDQYQTIPFIIDHDAPDFADLLPGLSNRNVRLHKSKKSK